MDTQSLIRRKIAEISAVADQLPVITIIHNMPAGFTVEYMSQRGLQFLRTSLPELKAMKTDYHDRYFNPRDAAYYVPRIHQLLEQNRPDEVLTFFQQVRSAPGEEWQWYLSSIRILLRDAQNQPLLTITQTIHIDPELHLTKKVDQMLRESIFFRDHYPLYQSLSRREREVLELLGRAMTNKEIAAALYLSVNTVESHKKNLKSKLGVRDSTELLQFARAFTVS